MFSAGRWGNQTLGEGLAVDPAGGRQAGSACNDLLGVDRVALLFITVGGKGAARVLEQAAGTVRKQPSRARFNGPIPA